MGAGVGKSARPQLTKDEAVAYAKQQGIEWDDEVDELFARVARDAVSGKLRDKVPRKELVAAMKELRRVSSGAGRARSDDAGSATVAVPAGKCPFSHQVPLAVQGNTHVVSRPTIALLEAIGGREALLRMTSRFYPMMFRDQQLSKFVTDTTEPHPERLADWIAEKMSGETYWSSKLHLRERHHAYDRSSAHVKAWNSPKREASRRGAHFKLDDSIMWMRLMFLSAREEGLATVEVPQKKKGKGKAGAAGAKAGDEEEETVVVESPFFTWFVQFLAHFVRVYESTAPPHARPAAEWSLEPANIARYERDGYLMLDLQGMR